MEKQSYKNHVRWYIPHHFVFYPVSTICVVLTVYYFSQDPDMIWAGILANLLLLIFIAYIMRQHYALVNQNRIVRLEMRFRYYVLTQKNFEPHEKILSFGQIAALRFASDEEFLGLLEKAINDKLTADEIKKAIKVWVPDNMRV